MPYKIENIESCFLGLAIGDALGVPVEFRSRSFLKDYSITTMTGYGAWNQPPGTWSDDSSLTFCLAESLVNGYDLNDIGEKFVKWFKQGYWGAHHKLFDIGGTTREALWRVANGLDPHYSGEFEEDSNGNGSLMRIIPASIYFHDLDNETLLERIREVSGITHAHFRSVLSCFIYSKFVIELFKGLEKKQAFTQAIQDINSFIKTKEFNPDETILFKRILENEIMSVEEDLIQTSGYVLHTLEASIWCFLNTQSYGEAVLKAVNLGEDTDTTACVTGGLAGLYYGNNALADEWRQKLAREKDIINLAADFTDCLKKRIFT